MAKGRPLRPDRRLPKPATANSSAFLARREAALRASADGFDQRMMTYQANASFEPEPCIDQPQPVLDQSNEGIDYDPQIIGDPGNENVRLDDEDPLIKKLRETSYQNERLEQESRWTRQYGLMLNAYLEHGTETSDWTSPDLWNHNYSGPCSCSATHRRSRKVDLVDISCEIFYSAKDVVKDG